MADEIEEIKRRKLKELVERMKLAERNILEVSDEDFDENVVELSKKIPVLVDFWAEWCLPCKLLAPLLEEVVREFKGKVVLAKANVDDCRKKALEYGVASIPNVKLFKGGKVVAEFVGLRPKGFVEEWLRKNLEE